ncbi:MAG: alpha/beta fold hydrolase [Verrucomicrobiota bacterium]
MTRPLLIAALAAVLSLNMACAEPYSPPPNDPFQPLIEDIDKNVAPVTTPANAVIIKGNKGETIKAITGGSEVVKDVKYFMPPDGEPLKNNVRISHVTFKSAPVYKDGEYHDDTIVYAMIAMPANAAPGDKLPGLLFLHGGGYFAQNNSMYSRVVQWAAAGYVVVACDLPGIASPEFADVASGTWRSVPYANISRFTVTPDIKASWLYTAEATALKAFALLKSQPEVDPSKIGIVGISWGGYSTVMLSGLLGDRVAAGFSVFGSGFYDEDSAWKPYFLSPPPAYLFKNDPAGLQQWETEGAKQWLTYLDAGRRAGGIKAHFYLASPANDHFFRPPAVVKTLRAITNAASLNFQFSPNSQLDPKDTNPAHDIGYYCIKSSHNILTPGGNVVPPAFSQPAVGRGMLPMEAVYFDYLLKGVGAPLSTIKLADNPKPDAQKNLEINFAVTADPSVKLDAPKLYYSVHTDDDTWEKRNWISLDAPMKDTGTNGNTHSYSVTLPAGIVGQNVDWYVLVSDTRGAWATTVTTPVYNTAETPK